MSRFLIATALAICLLATNVSAFDAPGVIKKVDADKRIIEIHAGGQDRTVKVSKDAKFLDKDGKELPDGLKSQEFKEGTTVTITVERSDDGPIIKGIRLGGKPTEKGPDAPMPPAADKPKGRPDGKDGPRPFNPQEGLKAIAGVKPLNEMTATDRYKGQDGGLYGAGRNEPPEALQAAARRQTTRIVPLDAEGKPAKGGKIVMVSIGMSNTTAQFAAFKQRADQDPKKSPHLVLVDGAQGGCPAFLWVLDGKAQLSPAEQRQLDEDCKSWYGREALQMHKNKAPIWSRIDGRFKSAGVTAQQVQVLWIKQVDVYPPHWGEFPAHSQKLQASLTSILNIAQLRYPNVKIAYLSSRTYGGYSTKALNSEPYAYESGFSVRSLIQEQLKGSNPMLNYDPEKGAVKAPLLLWGPYFWANGTTPRKSDGLSWQRGDFMDDGVHPHDKTGVKKVVDIMWTFFSTDPNARTWFLRNK